MTIASPYIPGRLVLALAGSILVNGVLWGGLSAFASYVPTREIVRDVEIQRVTIDQQGHKVEKVVKKEEIKKKLERLVKEHKVFHPKPERQVPSRPSQTAPPSAQNRVLSAPTTAKAPDSGFQALPGGNAPVGQPTTGQGTGNGTVNPPTPTPTPAPTSAPTPIPTPLPLWTTNCT